jgi:hypothetical protein
MEVMTSYDKIPEEERQRYEELIPNSMELLKSLEVSFRGKPIIGQYLNMLFYFRDVADVYKDLNATVYSVRSSPETGFEVCMPGLHKLIIRYLSILDATVDILDKFFVQLKGEGITGKFSRKCDEASIEINSFRNQVLHDKVLELKYFSNGEYVTCPIDIAGYRNIHGSIQIRLESSKEKDLGAFLAHTFINTKKIIQKMINLLSENL